VPTAEYVIIAVGETVAEGELLALRVKVGEEVCVTLGVTDTVLHDDTEMEEEMEMVEVTVFAREKLAEPEKVGHDETVRVGLGVKEGMPVGDAVEERVEFWTVALVVVVRLMNGDADARGVRVREEVYVPVREVVIVSVKEGVREIATDPEDDAHTETEGVLDSEAADDTVFERVAVGVIVTEKLVVPDPVVRGDGVSVDEDVENADELADLEADDDPEVEAETDVDFVKLDEADGLRVPKK